MMESEVASSPHLHSSTTLVQPLFKPTSHNLAPPPPPRRPHGSVRTTAAEADRRAAPAASAASHGAAAALPPPLVPDVLPLGRPELLRPLVLAVLQVAGEQPARGGVQPVHRDVARVPGVAHAAADVRGQLLPQLHAPLVKGVDAPDEALHGRAVLVERDQLAGGVGRELGEEQAQRGPVTREGAVREQLLGAALRLELLAGLPAGQGVRLGEEVGHELVVAAHLLPGHVQRVLALHEPDEVAGHRAPHVQQLEERVLAVGARLPEVDLAHVEPQGAAVGRDALAVALHGQLLDVRGEPQQRLRVGHGRARLVAQEGGVPHAQQAHHHHQVALEGRLGEVAVHGPAAGQEVVEERGAELEADGQGAHGRAHAVAPAHPVPELEQPVLRDAEAHHPGLRRRGGHGAHVPADDLRVVAQVVVQPLAHRARVQHRLGRGERLADHQHQGALGVEGHHGAAHVHRVHVGQEPQRELLAQARRRLLRLQALLQEVRAQVAAPDAHGHDVPQLLPRVPPHAPRAHVRRELPDLVQYPMYIVDDVDTVHHNSLVLGGSQRRVQHGPPLSVVDLVPPHHGFYFPLEPGFVRQLEQHLHGALSHLLAAVVQDDPVVLDVQRLRAVLVLEQLAQVLPFITSACARSTSHSSVSPIGARMGAA
eukprot:CAMPEP_0194577222 /NCGR_PEP_ID=MMETSP0292-20121207/12074_1 /TAXON_ID=39354 /ORGANISM="Heterosigma akashiwo, Strain CCMP2393" /LENGTH=651 /DNA_ID=CAMNT_0039429529 /DNA_START=282 /DNA_END=2236 /DNA_ORIENTATION=+